MEIPIEDYIKKHIEDGYIDNNLAPLKCPNCESEHLEEYQSFYEEHWGRVEYSVRCEGCKKHLSTWSYGSWDI